jgi:ribonuclease E/ribonuclease G
MSLALVVEHVGFGVRGALLRDDRLIDLVDADAGGDWVTDALFVGRVRSVDTKLNAAFVDIGLGIEALLNAKDARHHTGDPEKRPISRLVSEGQRLIVQGVREGEGGKGPRVTTDIKLFGFHLLWRPYGKPLEVQGPVRGRERAELQERGERLFGERGVTLRKLAADADDAVLVAEVARLEARWTSIEAAAGKAGRPGRLAGDDHPLERLIRAVLDPALERIEIADEELLARLRVLESGPLAGHGIEIVRLDPMLSAFEQTGVAAGLEEALNREVPLRRGGRLLIEPTAALTSIDVDGEGRTPLDLDLDAATEIARQVRLRNIGGTIVVDFVDLPARSQRQRLEQALQKAFRDDPVTVQIYPMSQLGLVQISRARRGRSLAARMLQACDACGGSGTIPSLRARAELVLGSLRRESIRRIRAAADLAAYLDAGEAAQLRRVMAPQTAIVADAALPPGAFELEGT